MTKASIIFFTFVSVALFILVMRLAYDLYVDKDSYGALKAGYIRFNKSKGYAPVAIKMKSGAYERLKFKITTVNGVKYMIGCEVIVDDSIESDVEFV